MNNMIHFSILLKSRFIKSIVLIMALSVVFLTSSVQAQNDLWIQKATLGAGSSSGDLARKGAVSFSIGSNFYIALGKGNSGYLKDVWAFDTINETWSQKANYPGDGRIGAFSFVVGNTLAVVGTGETSVGLSDNYYTYTESSGWSSELAFPFGKRAYATGFSVESKGYLIGGESSNGLESGMYLYSGGSWSVVAATGVVPSSRMKAIAFTIGDSVYYGTGNAAATTQVNDLYLMNTQDQNKEWFEVTAAAPFVVREGAIALSANGKGYIGFGSNTAKDLGLSDFWQFDPATASFTEITAVFPSNARELSVANNVGNRIFMGTGYGSIYYDDFYEYDPCAVPQIIVQPVGSVECEGINYVFSVEISNIGTESYNWYKGGSPMPGRVSDTLQLNGVTVADNGEYYCEISNPCGTIFSDHGVLEIIPIPINIPTSVLANPDVVCPGNTFDITLSADDNGGDYDVLKWYSDGCGITPQGEGVSNVISAPSVTTEYFVRWENSCGESDCDTVKVIVKENPVDPTGVNGTENLICNNFDVNDTILLIAEGGSGDSLSWYLDDICTNTSATFLAYGDTLVLTGVDLIPTQTTSYSVRWETYCGNDVFTSACLLYEIQVDGDYAITTQPNYVDVCNTGTEEAIFNIEITLGESISEIFYQWLKDDGVAIAGATTNELIISDVVVSDSGYYYCKTYNTCDTVYSDSAFLTVNILPEIIIQPTLLDTICEGDSVTFTIEATGTQVLQYQWFFNDVPTSSVDTSLTINPVTFNNTGNYFCRVINTCDTVFSDVISMEVDTLPVVTQQPLDQLVCLNGTAEFLVEADGTLPLSFQWYKIDDNGTSEVSGASNKLLQITNVQVTDTAFNYFCFVSNECSDGISSDTVSLAMHAQILVMDSLTSDTNNVCYDYASFIRLTVYGGEGDSIRWFENSCGGNELYISSDTIYNIQVPNVTTTYYARWENACGESVCDSVRIDVVQDPVMITELTFEDNQICHNAYDSLRITATGGQGDSIYWYEGFSCNGEPFAVTADTFTYIHNIPTNSVPYAAHWVNACGESSCTVGSLFINEFTYITDQTNNVDVCEGQIAEMMVDADGMDQLYYQWFFNGNQLAGENEDELFVGPITVADTGQYYCLVRSECDTTLSDSIPVVMFELPYFTLQPVDIWACEGGYDTLNISVAGAEPIDLRWFVDGQSFGSFTLEDTTYVVGPAVNSREYYAKITNLCGYQISDTAIFTVFDTLVINEHPKDQSLCLLDTARFDIVAESSEHVQYEWFKEETSGDISVGAGANLEIQSIGYDDEGNYYCIISDTCGELISDVAILTMNKPPNVITDPFGLTVCEGQNAELSVSSTGDSLAYSWFHDGAEIIPIINDSILRFEPIQRGDEGEYYVDIRNNCGFDASVPIQLGVDYLPDLLDSLVAVPDTICPECDVDYIELIAYGDGGGYGDSIVWYQDTVTVETVCGVGATIHVALPTQTTMYYAFWVNGCAPVGSGIYSGGQCSGGSGGGSGGSGGGGGGGTPNIFDGVQVYYQESPSIPLTVDANDTIFCINTYDSIWLFADGGYGDKTEWHIINGDEQEFMGYGDTLKVVAPTDTTIYAARMINMCGFSDSLSIQVNVVAMPKVFMILADTVCSGYPYEITESTVIASLYDSLFWNTSSPTGAFEKPDTLYTTYKNSQPITPYDTTRQFLYLSTQGRAPCGIQVDTLMLLTLPIPDFSISDTSVCRNDTVILEAQNVVWVEWRHVFDDDLSSDENPIDFYPQETTDYYVIGESTQGCIDTVAFQVDVLESPIVDLGDSLSLFSCEPIELIAGLGDGTEFYTWNTGSRASTIYVYETGSYSVVVQNVKNLNCWVSDTVYVSLCQGTMFLPTAFSPNGDGINESFKPISSDPTVEFHMMIFNRWGKMVFETHDIHQGWDGMENGELAPVGNYVYRINYQGQGKNAPGKKASETGTVMLVR